MLPGSESNRINRVEHLDLGSPIRDSKSLFLMRRKGSRPVKHARLRSRRSRVSSAALMLICVVMGPSFLASQEKNADSANAAAAPVSSADVITVPDGKSVAAKLKNDLTTATAKVGDDVELTVAHAVLQDDFVIIPKGTVLSGRITSVHRAGRASRNGSVSFSVDSVVLPDGEIAGLHPQPPATAGQNLRQGVETMGHIAMDPEFPPGGGIVLLAVGGPLLLFGKGHERVFYAGKIMTLYVHGPVSLKREAVLKVQPPPYKGPAQVFYKDLASFVHYKGEDLDMEFYCGRKYLGDVRPYGTLQLELNPGAYWLSAGKDGRLKLPLVVKADHRYYVERNAQGLSLKYFDDDPSLLEDGPLRNNMDFTSASPEVTADLLAMPPSDAAVFSR
jgi:hypothetical protein